jgi:hypothetical protein
VRDSGKTVVDAMIGEVLTTCEKFQWTINNGEKYLKDESRDVGALMMMKKVHVEFRPLGVIGAIVPWNYPFHNVFNPMIATLMTGNALGNRLYIYLYLGDCAYCFVFHSSSNPHPLSSSVYFCALFLSLSFSLVYLFLVHHYHRHIIIIIIIETFTITLSLCLSLFIF